MTTTLSTRQGVSTRACNRLKESLRDQEELLTNAAEIHDDELEQQFFSEHSRQMRQARRTIEAEMDTVEKALEKYSAAADFLDPDLPSSAEVLDKITTNRGTHA
ncbi:hypothetical protein RB195_003315 [Necator americanus]|uniref:Tubulin-specific chaperone A n=1 Tax=Necator americanus TaxID=51031 RepID=A0ABR1DN02_NECAM